ncbi:3-oxoacyl-[acyl-carrier protein] reductase [Azospirillum fermentarium]|uniref:SDR family oxidoreductase n=1 Tax=Azospirillum fermentarium TaxID=1233114 RepID=UPI002226C01C|nr:SDR family oxidoreductase [Azospirillum fermentarium]MCW2248447.1 3-oxoacyl-[acyl-carrier protein] reductase [Azospirillum fermentarium]
MDLGLTGKRALVLGASRGLGAAIARTLAEEGVRVTAAARSADKIQSWTRQLPPAVAARITPAFVDLADMDSIDRLADGVIANGGVTILVNNSGGPPPGPAEGAAAASWAQQFAAMAASLFHLTNRLLPGMREQGWGRIVTIGSSGMEQPIPNLALSNGVRGAVRGWSKTLATELAPTGITVNVVLPGRIQTERVEQIDRANAERQGCTVEETAAAARKTIPMGRYGTPQEFADTVAFLVSERASYITGASIRVDGGLIQGL